MELWSQNVLCRVYTVRNLSLSISLTFKRRNKSVCHLQALLEAQHILRVFRIRVKLRLFSKSQ